MNEKKYKAVALNEQLENRGRVSGEIFFTKSSFCFKNDDINHTLSISGLKIKVVKTGVKLFYFSHISKPDWIFYTSDKSIFEEKALENNEFANDIKRKISNKSIMIFFSILATLFMLIGLYNVGAMLNDSIIDFISDKVPIEIEEKLGELAYSNYASYNEIIEDEKVNEMVGKLTKPLIDSIKDKKYTYKFHVAVDETVNAFALPGGHVIINTGLIDLSDTPEEILGVIAHEIAHVEKKHAIKQILTTQEKFLIFKFIIGDFEGLTSILLDAGIFLLEQSFSREFELEADEVGIKYLIDSKINPNGTVEFFNKVDKMDKGVVEDIYKKIGHWASTHPETKERIKILKAQIGELYAEGNNIEIDFDIEEFKQILNKY